MESSYVQKGSGYRRLPVAGPTWKEHDAYQLAFERLLRDLKLALETPPAPESP